MTEYLPQIPQGVLYMLYVPYCFTKIYKKKKKTCEIQNIWSLNGFR